MGVVLGQAFDACYRVTDLDKWMLKGLVVFARWNLIEALVETSQKKSVS
jgi:hypothetical protein